jgi:hypothetical protein
MSDNSRLVIDESDLLTIDIADIEYECANIIELDMNLCDLEMLNQVRETFDDLIARQQHRSGLLYELAKVRNMLVAGGHLILQNKYTGERDPGYIERANMLLTKAGFQNILSMERDGRLVLEATRRPYLVESIRGDWNIREILRPDETLRCHEFAKHIYYYKDYNYDIEVAKQFDLHSDLFALFDSSGQIIAIARSAARVPGYYCPFMYALDEHKCHIDVPSEYKRFCEIMVLFQDGQAGASAFKRITEYMLGFFHDVAHYDSFWTTYDITDTYTGTYYKTRFMLSDYNRILTYRDFGGRWNLINTTKIKELSDKRYHIFSTKNG